MSEGLTPFEQGELAANVASLRKSYDELKKTLEAQSAEIHAVTKVMTTLSTEIASGKKMAWVFFAALGAVVMKLADILFGGGK